MAARAHERRFCAQVLGHPQRCLIVPAAARGFVWWGQEVGLPNTTSIARPTNKVSRAALSIMGRKTVAGWCAPSSGKLCNSDLNRAPTPAQVSRSCGPVAGLHLARRDIHQRCAERAWKNAHACAEFLRSSQFSECFWKIVWFSSHSRHFRSWQTGGITVLKTTDIAHVCQGTCMRNGAVFDAARCDTQLEDDATRRQHARLSLPATPVPLFQPSDPL